MLKYINMNVIGVNEIFILSSKYLATSKVEISIYTQKRCWYDSKRTKANAGVETKE